jgi:hypothetical protein
MADPPRVSSPSSTGGEGTFFEQHVNAYWLASLLVEAPPPILLDSIVAEVSFQTRHLGWATDDFLISARTGAGQIRRLAGQAKKALTVSASNEDFTTTVVNAWLDFQNNTLFSAETDALVIATQLGTNVLLRDFGGLLDCARASRSDTDFQHRIEMVVNARVRSYRDVMQQILDSAVGHSVPAPDVWRFLRSLYIFSLDLNTATSQAETLIKTLLAHTANDADRLGTADASWNALLKEVSSSMFEAKQYERADLPASLLKLHVGLAAKDHQAIAAIRDHSQVVISNLRTTIGRDLHLPREGVIQDLLQQLEQSRVLLIAGPAGSGKSAVAKELVNFFAGDHYVVAFRAEELARAHFDETLQLAQIPVRAAAMRAVLAAQPRKILLIESVERLLEAPTREAFSHLLSIVGDDTTWRLILTCRDYSVDLLRAALLQPAGSAHAVVNIPPLSDDEMAEVETHFPPIGLLLKNDRLRALLRNPYILDMATRTDWSAAERLPETEREFRAHFWRSVVRAEQHRQAGLPQRRADAFMTISARRAKALTVHASVVGIDPEAVTALQNDGLVVISPAHASLAAPAHDVLEDWGVIEWISEQYVATGRAVEPFAEVLGSFPAIRRTFRKWIAELVERDTVNANLLFDRVIDNAALPLHFRDDTIVAFLRSDHAKNVLERHASKLLADDKHLLRRVLHLLRVGCVSLPAWMPAEHATTSIFFQPEGSAWPAALALVQEHLDTFVPKDGDLLLGLVEDWAKSVWWQNPYPPGHGAAAAIALWLVPHFDHYSTKDQLKRVLRVLAKIPKSDAVRFTALLRGRDDHPRNAPAEELGEIVFEGIEGMPFARDLPQELVEIARRYVLAAEEDVTYEYRGSSGEMELLFGINYRHAHGFFPPSAFRGPYRPLLLHHWKVGRAFILEIFNHSAQWYAQPRADKPHVEPPYEITLTFADGSMKVQWGNARLWQLYRGTSVTSYALQCPAMALEARLFEIAEAHPDLLDSVLLQLIRDSDSVAVTAIAASLAMAYPSACGETLLVLLSNRECIDLDRQRMVHDQSGSIFGRLRQDEPMKQRFAEERAESDSLPHRKQQLETVIAQAQIGPFAARIHEMLDRHLAALPPVGEQTRKDQVWRLALHRMDLRKYSVSAAPTETVPVGEPVERDEESPPPQYLMLTPTTPDSDLQQMIETSATEYAKTSAHLGLHMWAVKVFQREEPSSYDPAEWRERLKAAQATAIPSDKQLLLMMGDAGPYVAAVCLRDHGDEMSREERDWCIAQVCAAVEAGADDWTNAAHLPGFMNPAVPAAEVIAKFAGSKDLPAPILRAFASAITHPGDETRMAAAAEAGRSLWRAHPELALQVVVALRIEAATVQHAFDEEQKKRYKERQPVEALQANAAQIARAIIRGERRPDKKTGPFDPSEWFGAESSPWILRILLGAPETSETAAAFVQISETLVGWWDADHRDRSDPQTKRRYETESAIKRLLVDSVFRVSEANAIRILQPLLGAINRHPDKVASIVRELTIREDREPATARFWLLWKLFAEGLLAASWLPNVDSEYSNATEFVSSVFLAVGWNDHVRHWRSLVGYAHLVHELFERAPVSAAFVYRYLLFLYHVGEQSLPTAYVRFAAKLRTGEPHQLLTAHQSVFLLESLLQRHVYAKPLELKTQEHLRTAVLYLLDELVEAGSSASFRMRDDFVTPLPPR